MANTITVLHVEDEPGFADLAATYLEREDTRISVHQAVTPEEAENLLAELDVDCVVSDYDMPGQNGIEILKTIRDEYPDLPFILYTGKGSEAVASEAISAGVTDYLQKHGGTEQYELLANRILNAVEQKRAKQRTAQLEEEHALIADVATDAFFVIDFTPGELRVSDGIAQFGYDPDAIGETEEWWTAQIHPEDREWMQQRHEAAMQPDETGFEKFTGKKGWFESEYRWQRADGSYAYVVGRGVTLFEDGKAVKQIVTMQDVTEQRERRQELELLETLIDHSRDELYVLDAHSGDIHRVNQTVCDHLGYSREELIGTPISAISTHFNDITDRESHLSRLQEEELIQDETTHIRADGTKYPAEASPVYVEIDDDAYEFTIARDITERKKRENELRDLYQTYRDLFDGINDAVFVHEPEGTFLEVNEEAIERHGYDKEELLELTPEDIDAADHAPHAADRIETIEEQGTYIFESVHVTKSGERIPVEVSSSTIDYFGDTAVLSVARDISERKQYEESLKQANEQLRLINRIVRHDIRNDMNIVLGWGRELEEHVDDEGEQMLSHILANGQHVVDLTKTLRDYIRAYEDEEKPELTPTDIGNVLENEIGKLGERYQRAVVEVPEELPHTEVRANKLITSVFWNLLQNAVKHNDKEVPRVEIEVETDEKTVTVRIGDNGPGIPEEQRKAIFGKRESGLEDPHAGIGLYLVNTVVTQYDGDVWVEENEPQGAMFVVELPKVTSEN